MNIAKKMGIYALAAVVEKRRLAVKYLGMRNTYGLDLAGRIKLTQKYEMAKAELWRAEAALRKAQRAYADGV